MSATRRKLHKYNEASKLPNIIITEISTGGVIDNLVNIWDKNQFENKKIVLELGCGKGEYTLALAKKNPDTIYIGVDIKSDRLFIGGRDAIENGLDNVFFLRTRIELIDHFFDKNRVSEIWITFPDPHPTKKGIKRRLTSERFLNLYKKIMKPDGIIHLKTDNATLYEFTISILAENNYNLICSTEDIYNSNITNDIALAVTSTFEEKFIPVVETIKYLEFSF